MNKRAIFGLLFVGGAAALLMGSKKAQAAPKGGPAEDLKDPDAPKGETIKEEDAARMEQQVDHQLDALQLKKRQSVQPKPQEFTDVVVNALITGSPAFIRKTAQVLHNLGFPFSEQLRGIADDLEKETAGDRRATLQETADAMIKFPALSEMKATPEPEPDDEPGEKPAPAPAPAPKPTAAKGSDFATGKRSAAALAAHLWQKAKGAEDRAMVRAYQSAHGLTPDGLFGPKTAGDVASFGVVPPVKNIYWPTNFVQARRDLRAVLTQYAQQFPATSAAMLAEARKIPQ
jgi:hypothetical protein